MIGANQYKLTWSQFEQLHEDKRTMFENLCRALFKRELCQEGVIEHSDFNHPGIEVAPVKSKDGCTRISFQAKYFDKRINYRQIKNSVIKIIEYYAGKLDVVYLYCNQAIKESNGAYKEIEGMLLEVGIRMVLITGQTILDQAMNYPSILSCFFGVDSLDDVWFEKNLKLSLENLGERYNSLFNIDTKAQESISLFLKEDTSVVEINSKKINVMKKLEKLKWSCGGKYNDEIGRIIIALKKLKDVNNQNLYEALEWKEKIEKECKKEIEILNSRLVILKKEIDSCIAEEIEYVNLMSENRKINNVLSTINALKLLEVEKNMINSRFMFVMGKMGTGKTQLLASSAKRLLDIGHPILLLLGHTFTSNDSIENQIINNLEGLSPGNSFEFIVATMSEKAILCDKEAVIFIDAINESSNREIWKNGINRIIATIEQYSNVKLVISLRTGFENVLFSQSVLDKINNKIIAKIIHNGLMDNTPSKIYRFMFNYGIPFSPEYYLQSEMTNPLFLTWFCKTYNGEEKGLITIINNVLAEADSEGSRGAGLTEKVGFLKTLLNKMIDISSSRVLTKESILEIPDWNTYGINNKIGYLKAIERTGVLVSYVINDEENYHIGYNLLEDYLKAMRIIEKNKTKEQVIEYCKKTLFDIDKEGRINIYYNDTIFAMVVSLYVMKYDCELIEIVDLVNDESDKDYIINSYAHSFIWRSTHISLEKIMNIIEKYEVRYGLIWKVFIENSIKEKSDLNALGLTSLLKSYPLNKRDCLWTIYINNIDKDDRILSLAYYIENGKSMEGLTEDKAYLLLVTYAWMLSSSNRILRDRISKAMIEILKNNLVLCEKLLKLFQKVDDPYIIQRLYGIVFGAVINKWNNKLVFKNLANWVYKEIFDREYVYPDILLRDYARLIIEKFIKEYPNDLEAIDIEKIRPPYKSAPIPTVKEVDYRDEKYKDSGLWPLLFSMKFDMNVKGIGMYGDFGRYVFQSALDYFGGVDKSNIYYYAIQFILEDLGYDVNYFAEYDQNIIGYERNYLKRIERIGKKYQWIAMYNILARISDEYQIKNYYGYDESVEDYKGPWNPYVRDFDPTLNVYLKDEIDIPQISIQEYGENSFCDVNSSEEEIDEWVTGDDCMFTDFPNRLLHKDEFGKEWVSVYIYQENKYIPDEERKLSMGFPKGEQHIWTIVSMYIIPKSEGVYDLESIKNTEGIRGLSGNIPSQYKLYSKEYAWSPGYYDEFNKIDCDYDENYINAFPAMINFLWEEEYDASQDEIISYYILAGQILQVMQLYEKEKNGVYYMNDEIVAFDMKVLGNDNSELIIRRDVLDEYISRTGNQVFWIVNGEKQYSLGNMNQKWKEKEGYFLYDKKGIVGEIVNVDNH